MDKRIKILIVGGIWLFLLACAAVGFRYWWTPKQERQAQEKAVAEKQETINRTTTPSRYSHSMTFAVDSFSGYAPFRSAFFKEEAAKFGILIDVKDDGGNYTQRLKDLADGKIDMAVFTIDALVKCSAELGDIPVSIVAIADESKGADAMIAAGKTYPNIDALNNPETRIVCAGSSPSEAMGRVIMAHFNLDRLNPNPFEFKASAEEVFKDYRASKPGDKKVFILWEPYVSKIADNPDYHILIDSSKFRGYIVDVIVARRGYLVKNQDQVEQIVKSYFTTVFNYRNTMPDMITEDSRLSGDPLKPNQVERLCKQIWWKNTQENFGHFGLDSNLGLQHIEDISRNITHVLLRTGAIKSDPTNGRPNLLHYDGIIKNLSDSGWHPGFGQESVREEKALLKLTDQEWTKLRPVGTLQIPRLVFGRGSSRLTQASETTLEELVEKLKSFPQYYLTVRGNASAEGDLEANLKLAGDRANSTVEWLIAHGVDRNRIRSETVKPNGSTTVVFVLGEQPY